MKRATCEEQDLVNGKAVRFCCLLFTIVAFFSLASCNPGIDSSFSPQIVIQGFLYADEPIDSVIIRQTIPITADNESDRVSGAKVSISVGDSTYQLIEGLMAGYHGRYIPSRRIIVQAGKSLSDECR